ncbi:hypothetical protein [Burkholderia sp. WSM2232]|uniref:hypothetical protein n=1 Tax=Burkholderia sp. WSM2232 TaxID=944436 RepID=UPI000405BAED|nr:hypothetical protein [Burkholderia sp. WSM2232]
MSDTAQFDHDHPTYASPRRDGDDGPLDAREVLFAYVTGLCSGAFIIFGTTVVVCTVMRLL